MALISREENRAQTAMSVTTHCPRLRLTLEIVANSFEGVFLVTISDSCVTTVTQEQSYRRRR